MLYLDVKFYIYLNVFLFGFFALLGVISSFLMINEIMSAG